MKTKMISLFGIILLITISGAFAFDLPSDTADYSLNCYFPTTHFMKLDDGVLRVNCFTNTNNISCVSKIYNLINGTDYDEILQINPDVVHNSRVSPFFTPENNQLNVYFNDKNLLWGQNFTYGVECSGSDGVDVDYGIVQVENNKLVSNNANRIIDFKDNVSYWYLGLFILLVVIAILVLFINFYKNR